MTAVTTAPEFKLGRTVLLLPNKICKCGSYLPRMAIAETHVEIGPFRLDAGVSLDGTVHLPNTLSDQELAERIRKVVRQQVLDELNQQWGAA